MITRRVSMVKGGNHSSGPTFSTLKTMMVVITILIMVLNTRINDQGSNYSLGISMARGFIPTFNRTIPRLQINTNQISYSKMFNKCWNTSPIMTVDLQTNVDPNKRLRNITSSIPDSFYCETVKLWNSYGVSPYFITYLLASVFGVFTDNDNGEYELCGKVRKWEEHLHVECESMLCDYKEQADSLPDYINQITNGETTIFDWLNYCKYCKEGNSSYTCNPKDDYSTFLIASFPTSSLYCGTLEFGIPIVVNTSQVPKLISASTHFNTELDFNFICYCLDSYEGYFSFKCSDNKNNYKVHLFTKITTIILHGITIVWLIFLIIIPKIVFSIRKGRYNFILPSIACLLGELFTFTALTLSETVVNEFTIIVMDYIALACGAIALYSWLGNWLRLILLLKNGEEPRFLKWIHFGVVLICFCVAIGAILTHTFTTFDYTFLLIYSLLALVTVISFVSLILYVFRTMKQFSDVNVLKTSLIHYLVFMAALIIIAPSTKVLEIAFIFTSLSESLRYMFLFILFVSVAYMDSNRDEISHVYSKLWKIIKRERPLNANSSNSFSEPFLNSLNNNEMTDSK